MKSSHWIMAGVVALALGCAGPAFAEHEKGHHEGGGKWRHGGVGCQMSPGKRALVHEAMQKARKENEALMKQAHERHAALNKALGAKKFSQQAFLKAYDALASLQAQKQRNRAEAFAGIAGKLSPAERKKCARFLAGGMHHPGMMGRGPGGPWMHHRGMHHGEGGGPAKFDRPIHGGDDRVRPSGKIFFNE